VDVVHVASEKDLKETSSMGIQKTRKENRKKLEDSVRRIGRPAALSAKPHVYIGDDGALKSTRPPESASLQ
jgi:hypothetical protein